MNSQLPVTIFTGFLGAGKTTLLKNLLPNLIDDYRVAIIVNEIGETSIDGQSIASRTHAHAVPELHEITGKLIGTSSDDALDKLLTLFERRAGEIDHLFIETSGLAVPDSLINRLQGANPTTSPFTIDATVAVVDVPDLLSNRLFNENMDRTALPRFELAERDVFISQVATADVVVFNKIDDLDGNQTLQAESLIRTVAPTVRFIELAHHGQIGAALVTGMFLNRTVEIGRHQPNIVPVVQPQMHSHSGLENHDHGIRTHQHLHDHDPHWMAIQLSSSESQPSNLASALETLSSRFPLLRIKGSARLDGGHDVDVQAVRNKVLVTAHPHHHLPDENTSNLVLIGYDIDRMDIAFELSKLTSTFWD